MCYGVSDPFPVSESLLCYYVAFLAQEGLAMGYLTHSQSQSPSSAITWLFWPRRAWLPRLLRDTWRHSQILLGYPEPREVSTLPRLRLVLRGVTRTRALQQQTSRPRLPITGEVLGRLFQALNRRPGGPA